MKTTALPAVWLLVHLRRARRTFHACAAVARHVGDTRTGRSILPNLERSKSAPPRYANTCRFPSGSRQSLFGMLWTFNQNWPIAGRARQGKRSGEGVGVGGQRKSLRQQRISAKNKCSYLEGATRIRGGLEDYLDTCFKLDPAQTGPNGRRSVEK